jgi:hypothetical protein
MKGSFGWGRFFDEGFLAEWKLLEGENELLKGKGLLKGNELLKENC